MVFLAERIFVSIAKTTVSIPANKMFLLNIAKHSVVY